MGGSSSPNVKAIGDRWRLSAVIGRESQPWRALRRRPGTQASQRAADDLANLAHTTAKKISGKNMLMPKPKPDRHFNVVGRWRHASATRGRRP